MMKIMPVAIVAALFVPLTAFAAPNYSYVGARYIDNGNFDANGLRGNDYNGFNVRGSLAVAPYLFVQASYDNLNVTRLDDHFGLISSGLGLHLPLPLPVSGIGNLDVFGVVSYQRIDFNNGIGDGNGFGISSGLRWKPVPTVEFKPFLGYVNYLKAGHASNNLDGIRYGIDGVFNACDALAITVGYESTRLYGPDVDLVHEVTLGARVYF